MYFMGYFNYHLRDCYSYFFIYIRVFLPERLLYAQSIASHGVGTRSTRVRDR